LDAAPPAGWVWLGGVVNGQGGQLRGLVGRALVSLATTLVAAALLAPTALASPIGDAEAAIMAAWEKAGGDTSPLGARKGDVYPVADGFALDFDSGRMYYTTATGAKYAYGPVLDKYQSLGGPAGSDLGFPTINEVPGLAGPDSRVATFSATDKPVIFWTPDHGAFAVRGALNAAWDRLGSSGGVLGAPIADETYDADVISQKFSGGQISWNSKTKEFTTNPAALADQLKGLQVTIDPTVAIGMAWRAAGGASGPLGLKQGAQYSIGGDGVVQDFAGGKVYYSPATGANAVESDILAKYESLGGPVGSDLGFPAANETDGGIGSASRVVTFSAADKPMIFWTQDHGAFVVRGAMKAAWDKLRAPGGKLGAPVGDQAVDGDVISQKFTNGKISWNRAKNSFTTDPANLAPLLSGLQVAGQNQPSTSAMPSHAKEYAWHWWYLLAIIPLLVLVALLVFVAFGWRRRRSASRAAGRDIGIYNPDQDMNGGYELAADGRWTHDDADLADEHLPLGDVHPSEARLPQDTEAAARISWSRAGADDVSPEDFGLDDEDPDAVDTTTIPVVSDHDLADAGDAEDGIYPDEDYADDDHGDDGYPDDGYPDEGYRDEGYRDVAVPRTPLDAGSADGPEGGYRDLAVPHTAADQDAVAVDTDARTGRHAAVPSEQAAELTNAGSGPARRPTIHPPLDDPYRAPDGYPIKASARFGLYYTPSSALYDDTIAEFWLSSEEVAEANGFVKAD
jgi:uncharacterized protein with LGFP repeats